MSTVPRDLTLFFLKNSFYMFGVHISTLLFVNLFFIVESLTDVPHFPSLAPSALISLFSKGLGLVQQQVLFKQNLEIRLFSSPHIS